MVTLVSSVAVALGRFYWDGSYPIAIVVNTMSDISAQISIYPLGQVDLAPVINEVIHVIREFNLDVIPGSMSTLIYGDDETVFAAPQAAFQRAAEHGRVVMVSTISNACPAVYRTTEHQKS